MIFKESTEDEMRADGFQKPDGKIYCKRCGWRLINWEKFFQHHKERHPWEDPEVLKAAMERADEEMKWWRAMYMPEKYGSSGGCKTSSK